MNEFIAMLPLIISAAIPPLVSLARSLFVLHVNPKWFPVLLPIGGGLVGALANLLGVDATILASQTSDPQAWQTVITGITSGLASVGIHQIYKQQVK